jgi:hypothetical protein
VWYLDARQFVEALHSLALVSTDTISGIATSNMRSRVGPPADNFEELCQAEDSGRERGTSTILLMWCSIIATPIMCSEAADKRSVGADRYRRCGGTSR